MTSDLDSVLALRRVMESAGQGRGLAASLVQELGRSDRLGREVAKKILLGHRIPAALEPLKEKGFEVGTMASLAALSSESSVVLLGQKGEELSFILERWLKAKSNKLIEEKVLRFRSVIASAVLGAVAAMVATMGALFGSLTFPPAASPGGIALAPAGAAMVAASTSMLGLFVAGRRFYVCLAVGLLAYSAAYALASPLAASFP